MADVKAQLREFIAQQKRAKAQEDRERKQRYDSDRAAILNGIGADLVNSLKPVVNQLAQNSKVSQDEIRQAFTEAIKINMPDMPTVEVPPITIDTTNLERSLERAIKSAVSNIKIESPIVNVAPPQVTVPDRMGTGIDDVSRSRPLPVSLFDLKGNPMSFPAGASGGKADFLTIKGFGTSAFSELTNPDGRLKVELPSGSSGLTDTELRAAHLDVQQLSGSVDSVYVAGAFGSTTATGVFNADNRLRVSVETGGSGLTDTELRATAVPVSQLSGASWSTEATQAGTWNIGTVTAVTAVTSVTNSIAANIVDSGGVPYTTTNPLPIGDAGGTITIDGSLTAVTAVTSITNSVASSLVDSTGVQYSGSNPVPVGGTLAAVTAVTSITNSVASSLVDSTGVQYSGSNPVPISDAGGAITVDGSLTGVTTVTAVTGITNSVAAANVDSTGVQYSGSNPFPVYLVLGTGNSTVTVGPVAGDVADDGSSPVQIGGIARTANPTAVAANDVVKATMDDLGRQVMRPVQVRDLIGTAYATVTNITETSLIAGASGVFNDLISVVAANQSTGAVTLDFRASTGGTVTFTLEIPATGTAGISWNIPYPAPAAASSWTIQNASSDDSTTSVDVTATFSKEV